MAVGIIAVAVGAAMVTFGDNIETAIENISEQVGAIETEEIDLG